MKTSKTGPSPKKAREILHDGTVHGAPLTARQRRFMGAMTRERPERKFRRG